MKGSISVLWEVRSVSLLLALLKGGGSLVFSREPKTYRISKKTYARRLVVRVLGAGKSFELMHRGSSSSYGLMQARGLGFLFRNAEVSGYRALGLFRLYIYIYINLCVYIYIYTYIYIDTFVRLTVKCHE